MLLVVEVGRRAASVSLDELSHSVAEMGYSAFSTWAYDSDSDDLVLVQSLRTIRRTIRLAAVLGIVDEGGEFDAAASRAVLSDEFPEYLISRCWLRMAEVG